MIRFLAVAPIAALSACASMPTIDQLRQDASSGLIGCPPREIQISANERLTWTATCRGRVFYCSTGAETACAPASEPTKT